MNYVREKYGKRREKKNYINEAIMEMKPNEFGANSGITPSSLLQDPSCHTWRIRACGIVKFGTQLSINRASKNGNQEES